MTRPELSQLAVIPQIAHDDDGNVNLFVDVVGLSVQRLLTDVRERYDR